MKVKIVRVDKSLPLPVYETGGSVGFDFLARENVYVKPRELALIPANVIIEVPAGFMLLVASRSSTPRKKGLLTPHGIGIIDNDYCGSEDEIHIQVYNFSDKDVLINKGEKIAQGVFVRVGTFEWQELDVIKSASRGGFGSTDSKYGRLELHN